MDEATPQVIIHSTNVNNGVCIMEPKKRCWCRRSRSGFCDGSHKITEPTDQKNKLLESETFNQNFHNPWGYYSSEVKVEKARTGFERPSLDLIELDAFIHSSLRRS